MRLFGLLTFALLVTAGASWSFSPMWELTPDNIDAQSFEFKFERSDNWFQTVVKVTVRPRQEDLSKIRDRVGGRLYRCQQSTTNTELQMTAARAEEKDGSLVYTFRVLKGTHKCFYFWQRCSDMPCVDTWWVSLDSPLVRGEETPK
jgi:hypothetical protein